MAFPRSPAHLRPFSRAASFYVTLGTLSILLWVISSFNSNSSNSSSGSLLFTCPKFLQSLREMRNIASSSYTKYYNYSKSREPAAAISFSAAEGIAIAIESVTARAGPVVPFEEKDEDQWHMENPCRSRVELPMMYARRKLAQNLASNAAWERVLAEYSRMHRTCLGQVRSGNIADHFFGMDNDSGGTAAEGCKFLLVDAAPAWGLGSKIVFQASAVLLAVLTQRVVLIAGSSSSQHNNSSTDHFCEPFVGSSWTLSELHSSRIRAYPALWTTRSEFHRWVDDKIATTSNDPNNNINNNNNQQQQQLPDELHAVDFGDMFGQSLERFYCSTEQAYMSKVTWISIAAGAGAAAEGGGGRSYFLPKLFAMPAFRAALEDMFPDRMALPHILRTVFLPADPVWERIDDISDLYLRHSQSLVGVQLKRRHFRHDLSQEDEAAEMNDWVNERVLDCITANELLPPAPPLGGAESTSSGKSFPWGHGYRRHRNGSKVFIVSLFPVLHDHLSQIYVRRVTAAGDGVGLVQLTTQESQQQQQQLGGDWEVDVEAFVQIICLSLADHLLLLVSPVSSSFGGLAQAYGALRPWVISLEDIDNGGRIPAAAAAGAQACERVQSVDVCFDHAAAEITSHCPHDPDFHGLLDSVPYIRKCLERDGLGMQLIADHGNNPSSPSLPSNDELLYSSLNS